MAAKLMRLSLRAALYCGLIANSYIYVNYQNGFWSLSYNKHVTEAQSMYSYQWLKLIAGIVREMILQEEGELIGLIQARVLANVRAGLRPSAITAIMQDTKLALSLDTTSQQCIYRKAAVWFYHQTIFQLHVVDNGFNPWSRIAPIVSMRFLQSTLFLPPQKCVSSAQ